jgi:hypothetical protein
MIYTTDILLAIAREMEPAVAPLGAHVAIGGSCVYRGYSTKDMDLMVYPRKKEIPVDKNKLLDLLLSLGWSEVHAPTVRTATSVPDVLVMQRGNLRVDFFILSR